jgi:type VI secretion system protein ImpJ
MKTRKPLFWHQGLLLQPHHFQQADAVTQALLIPYQKYVQPHLWGLGNIEVQSSALNNHVLNIESGELLFPDLTHVQLPGNALVESRSFENSWPEGDKPLSVYLGLRRWNPAGRNVTVVPSLMDCSGVHTRFVTLEDGEEAADLHQEGPSATLRHMQYLLRVFWEDEVEKLGDYILMPLARLERSGEEIRLSKTFIPPSLTIAASEVLMRIVREVRDQIASRGSQLEEYKRERGIHSAEFGSRDMVYLLALRSLNRYASLLFQYTDTGGVHPWNVYGLFRQLIGELSTFSEGINAMGEAEDPRDSLLEYDHRRLWQCFSRAQALVSRLLDDITAGPEYMIELVYDGTYFAAELKPAMFEGQNRFYLVCETDQEPQEVVEALESIAKLGTRETLPILIARALPGIKLKHLPLPPQELPRRSRAVYFQVDHYGDAWAAVQKAHNLALYWDAAPEDLRVELMIVGRS